MVRPERMRVHGVIWESTVPEIIDLVFAKTSPKRSFCMTENERFGLVFVKTGFIYSGTGSSISLVLLGRRWRGRRTLYSTYIFIWSTTVSVPSSELGPPIPLPQQSVSPADDVSRVEGVEGG
jgi:hypothetical protein